MRLQSPQQLLKVFRGRLDSVLRLPDKNVESAVLKTDCETPREK